MQKFQAVEDQMDICRLYQEEMLSFQAIASRYSCSLGPISRILHQHEVPIRAPYWNPHHLITPVQEQEILTLYLAGESMKSLARAFRVDRGTIAYHLKKAGCPIRSATDAKRQYRLNESVFDGADSCPEAAYHVGFLMADGYVVRPERASPVLGMTLSACDRIHLERLKRFLETDRPLYEIRPAASAPAVVLSISSARIADCLARYGVVPRKSATAQVHGLEFNRWFWAGVVDGDGSICFAGECRRPVLSLVGSRLLVEQFAAFVKQVTPLSRGSVHRHKTIWAFAASGNPALAVIRALYADNPYALPRKATRAEEAMGWVARWIKQDRSSFTREEMLALKVEYGTWNKVAKALGVADGSSIRHIRHRLGL